MDLFLEELATGWPDAQQLMRVLTRLIIAALLGAVVGIQRERAGKSAGLKTHMLVALGTTLFVLACQESGMSSSDLSRVIQGLSTGIGFIGAGTILKLSEEEEIKGLTTAAGIWMTAAAGVGIGLGQYGVATLGVVLTWIILAIIGEIEYRIEKGKKSKTENRRK